jgi:major membrane immunogen (membrane-anchored lipoprotein)
MVKLLVIVVLACLLVGCGHTDRKGLLAAGFQPDYVDGYVDGYSAGCHAIGHPFYRFTRDTQRYEVDGRYKNGWEDGFSIARTDYAAIR